MTIEAAGGQIRRARNYFLSPDALAEVCTELELPYRANGYRHWLRRT